MRILTFARHYPAYHPRKGESTHFVEKIWKSMYSNNQCSDELSTYINRYTKQMKCDLANYNDLHRKLHTIRANHNWKAGDMFSPRVWSGKPYASKQIEFAPAMEVKRVYDFGIQNRQWLFEGIEIPPDLLQTIATNDGLILPDFISWFKWPKVFSGQVIIWDEKLKY